MKNRHSRKFQDITGQKFGRWTVLGLAVRAKDAGGATKWLCRCECGNEAARYGHNLKSGMSESCGCLKREIDSSGTPRPWRKKFFCSKKERSLVYRKRYREEGRTKRLGKERYHANLAKSRAVGVIAANRRRAREASAPGSGVSKYQWQQVLGVFGGKCAYCLTRDATTMDHVVALAAGGAHDVENVVPACKSCNSAKHTKPLLQFVMHGGGVV